MISEIHALCDTQMPFSLDCGEPKRLRTTSQCLVIFKHPKLLV